MKRLVVIPLFVVCSLVSIAQESISVEAEFVGVVNGIVHYELYAYFPDEDYGLDAIYGSDVLPLSLTSVAGFVNAQPRLYPHQCSWNGISGFTIDCMAVGFAEDVSNPLVSNGNYAASSLTGAAIYVNEWVLAGTDKRVLIGKFASTVTGISGNIPMRCITPDGTVINQSYSVATTIECNEFLGCMDPSACNWDPEAECPDNSCIYEDECGVCGGTGIPVGVCDCDGSLPQPGYNCDGLCINDSDEDGVCDEFEIEGCQDPTACDFNSAATNAMECDYSCLLTMSIELVGVMDFTTPFGGVSGKAIHLIANADVEDLGVYGVGVANNGLGTDGKEYSFPSISVSAGENILIARDVNALQNYFSSCWGEFSHVVEANTSVDQNGNDAIELYEFDEVIDVFGDPNTDMSGTALDYTDSWAYKVVADSWIVADVDCTDGSQSTLESSCPYPLCDLSLGCTDPEACNFNPDAESEDGSCLLLDACGVCGGDNSSCTGCTQPGACNYDEEMTQDDGSCLYSDDCGICGGDNSSCSGCTSTIATNFDAIAVIDDGSCLYDQDAYNACVNAGCPGDFTADGYIGVDDILSMLSLYDTSCSQ